MQNEFHIDTFEPVKLKKAKLSLEKHFSAVQEYEQLNEMYQKSVFQESLWRKFLRFFIRN